VKQNELELKQELLKKGLLKITPPSGEFREMFPILEKYMKRKNEYDKLKFLNKYQNQQLEIGNLIKFNYGNVNLVTKSPLKSSRFANNHYVSILPNLKPTPFDYTKVSIAQTQTHH